MASEFVGKYVIVRTYSAGVHFGKLKSRKGKEVTLTNARRIWQWSGAFTLSAVAVAGIKAGRLSVAVPVILLTEAVEIIPCSADAGKQLAAFKAHNP